LERRPLSTLKKHLLILAVVTILARGLVLISYSNVIGRADEVASQYMASQLLHGNFLVGSLRYNFGYAFVMTPVVALTNIFGPLQPRIIILVQSMLAGLIPFLIYDILRKRRSGTEALTVALIAALDPFALQWTQFFLPIWLLALCTVLAFWLIERSMSSPIWNLLWIALAGISLGIAALARLEFALVAAALGFALLFFKTSWPTRLKMFTIFGIGGGYWLFMSSLSTTHQQTLGHYPVMAALT